MQIGERRLQIWAEARENGKRRLLHEVAVDGRLEDFLDVFRKIVLQVREEFAGCCEVQILDLLFADELIDALHDDVGESFLAMLFDSICVTAHADGLAAFAAGSGCAVSAGLMIGVMRLFRMDLFFLHQAVTADIEELAVMSVADHEEGACGDLGHRVGKFDRAGHEKAGEANVWAALWR